MAHIQVMGDFLSQSVMDPWYQCIGYLVILRYIWVKISWDWVARSMISRGGMIRTLVIKLQKSARSLAFVMD